MDIENENRDNKRYKRKNGIDSLLDWENLANLFSTGQYTSANIAASLLGQTKNSGKGVSGLVDDILAGKGPQNLFGETKNAGKFGMVSPIYDAIDGIKAGLSMKNGRKGDYQDVLRESMGLADTGDPNMDIALNAGRETLGSAGNIFLDPVTYITGGGGKVAGVKVKPNLANWGDDAVVFAAKNADNAIRSIKDLVRYIQEDPEFQRELQKIPVKINNEFTRAKNFVDNLNKNDWEGNMASMFINMLDRGR